MRVKLLIRGNWCRFVFLPVVLLSSVLLPAMILPISSALAAADKPFIINSQQGAAAGILDVSDVDLAVAIFIPAVFLAATGGLIAWAWANREREGAGREPEDEGSD